MQTADFIGVMLEELQTKYLEYLRLRHEFERTLMQKKSWRAREPSCSKTLWATKNLGRVLRWISFLCRRGTYRAALANYAKPEERCS